MFFSKISYFSVVNSSNFSITIQYWYRIYSVFIQNCREDINAATNFIYNFARAKTTEGSIQRNFRRGQLRVESANCAIIRNDKEVNVCETTEGKRREAKERQR